MHSPLFTILAPNHAMIRANRPCGNAVVALFCPGVRRTPVHQPHEILSGMRHASRRTLDFNGCPRAARMRGLRRNSLREPAYPGCLDGDLRRPSAAVSPGAATLAGHMDSTFWIHGAGGDPRTGGCTRDFRRDWCADRPGE